MNCSDGCGRDCFGPRLEEAGDVLKALVYTLRHIVSRCFALIGIGAVGCVVVLSGCVRLSKAQLEAHALAPLDVVPEVSRGATFYRLLHGRWPLTLAELENGLRASGVESAFLQKTVAFSVQEVSSRSILYQLRFAGGGLSEVTINLNPSHDPAGGPHSANP